MKVEEAMRREYSAAKLAWLAIGAAHVLALAVAGAAIWHDTNPRLALAVAIVFPIVGTIAKKYGSDRYGRAERLRRALACADGWGGALASVEQLLLRIDTTVLPTWDPPSRGKYFSSKRPTGGDRMVHITQQAAFFSHAHARLAFWCCVVLMVPGLVFAGTLLWMIAEGTGTDGPRLARGMLSLLALLTSGELAQTALGYWELARDARSTVDAAEHLLEKPVVAPRDVMLVVGAYDAALAKAPPLPGLVYRVQRERLEADWRRRESKAARGQGPVVA